MHREFWGKFNLVRTTKVYRLHIKQYICDKLFVNRQFWKIHSADLSKVPHRYAAMLTIYTRLVHPHPFVTERAVMFSNKRACHFRTKTISVPDEKFKSKRSIGASIIRRVSKTPMLRLCKRELTSPKDRENTLIPPRPDAGKFLCRGNSSRFFNCR